MGQCASEDQQQQQSPVPGVYAARSPDHYGPPPGAGHVRRRGEIVRSAEAAGRAPPPGQQPRSRTHRTRHRTMQIPSLVGSQRPGSPPTQAPEVREARTIVSQASLQRNTLRLAKRRRRTASSPRAGRAQPTASGATASALASSGSAVEGPSASKTYRVSFDFDCTQPCTVSVYAHCVERGVKAGRVSFSAIDESFPVSPMVAQSFDAGSGQRFTSEFISFGEYPTDFSKEAKKNCWMLVIELSTVETSNNGVVGGRSQGGTPEESPATPDASGRGRRKRHRQFHFTYCTLDLAAGTAQVSHQKLQVGREVFEVEDIYGGAGEGDDAGGEEGGVQDGGLLGVESNAQECAICLCEPRDTLIMPCRHKCLCSTCAEMLRTRSNQCPICREVITGLITRSTPPPSPVCEDSGRCGSDGQQETPPALNI